MRKPLHLAYCRRQAAGANCSAVKCYSKKPTGVKRQKPYAPAPAPAAVVIASHVHAYGHGHRHPPAPSIPRREGGYPSRGDKRRAGTCPVYAW